MIAAAAMAATILVHNDVGGSVQEYHQAIMDAGPTRVEISGYCYSACTLWLGAQNVCVHRDASFGFHGPTAADPVARAYGEALMVMLYTMAGGRLAEWFVAEAARLEGRELAPLTAQQVVRLRSAEWCD